MFHSEGLVWTHFLSIFTEIFNKYFQSMIYWQKWSGCIWFLMQPINDVRNFSSVTAYTFSEITLHQIWRILLFCVLQFATETIKIQLLYLWTSSFLNHRQRYNNKNNKDINIIIIIICPEPSNLVKAGQNGGHFTWRPKYVLLLPAALNRHKLLYLDEVVSSYQANPGSIGLNITRTR